MREDYTRSGTALQRTHLGLAPLRERQCRQPASAGDDPTCPGNEYSWFAGADMEYMGLGMLLAVWRYFFDVDWDVRVRRRKHRKNRHRT